MQSDLYTKGFIEKLAELTKSAKLYSEMSDAEKAKADEYAAKDDAKVKRHTLKEYVPEAPADTFGGAVRQSFRRFGNYMGSLGRGAASTAGVAALRGAQALGGMAAWIPNMADEYIFGKALGVDEGRGLYGRLRGWTNRKFDSMVDRTRRFSSDYDYEHGIAAPVQKMNQFASGQAADAVGAFGGTVGVFGGGKLIQGIKGARNAFRPGGAGWRGSFAKGGFMRPMLGGAMGAGFAGMEGYSAGKSSGEVDPETGAVEYSPQQQLRMREEQMRRMKPYQRVGFDPTSTAYNQEHAPTAEEYRRYHMPMSGLPTSETGTFRAPFSWGHQSNGNAVQFKAYGT